MVELFAGWSAGIVRLEGWSHIPAGYGASFALERAPRWLRLWFRMPFVDRFAYPFLVHRGFGYLTADPGISPDHLGEVGSGWRIVPDGPGSPSTLLRHDPRHLSGRAIGRRRYARPAWPHRVGRGLTLPPVISLPGGLRLERHEYLYWRIRLCLLALTGTAGALIAGRPGVLPGVSAGVLVEVLVSYRLPHGARPASSPT